MNDAQSEARADVADVWRWYDSLKARLGRVEALLTEPSPAKFDSKGNYEGRVAGTEHRTVGDYRAWCYQCSEWCYPESYACPCCEPKVEPADLRTALDTTPCEPARPPLAVQADRPRGCTPGSAS